MPRFSPLPLAILAVACLLAIADDGGAGVVRWIAAISLVAIAAWIWLRPAEGGMEETETTAPAAPARPVRQTAVLLVEVSTAAGTPLRPQDIELVKGMVEQCVRITDTVRQVRPDTLAVDLKNVTWELADQIGCRIRDHVQELIIFDEKGLLIVAVPKIGGALTPHGDTTRLEDQANANLAQVRALNAPGVLLTQAG